MASSLDEFLGLADVADVRENIKVMINGKLFDFEVSPMTQEVHSKYQRRCLSYKNGKADFDKAKYNLLCCSEHITSPNFSDAAFLQKAKCDTAIDFLSKKFPAGVLENIAEKIADLSGFKPIDMEIDEAKN